MIRYELKKIWGRRIFLLAFVIFVILDSAKIMYDSYKYHPKNIYNIRRSELYDMVEGEWNSETIDYVVSTYKNASKIVSSGSYSTEPDQPGTFTGYIFGDYGLFGEVFDKMDYMYNYHSEMESTLKKAVENVELYEKLGNEYSAAENRKILEMYSDRSVSAFYDTDGAFALFSYDIASVMIMMLMILSLAPVFTCEKETEMQLLLRTSVNGGKRLIIAKIVASLLTALVITVVFSAVDIVTFTTAYGIKCYKLPLYAIKQFSNTPLSCSIGAYFSIDFLYKISGILIMSLIYLILSSVSPDEIISFCSCFAVTILFILMDGAYNPIRLMTSRELFIEFDTINILGIPVMVYTAVIPIAAITAIMLMLILFFTGKRKFIGRYGMKTIIQRAKERLF